MRSTFSVSTWTWTLAGCLALFLGCSQGEGDRCEVDSDCSGDLICSNTTGSPHNGICRPRSGSGAAGNSGQSSSASTSTGTTTIISTGATTSTGTSTITSTGTTTSTGTSSDTSSAAATGTGTSTGTGPIDASVAPTDAGVDAPADEDAGSADGSLAD